MAEDRRRLEDFLAGLQQLPPLTGLVWRGCSAASGFVQVGQTVAISGPMPATRSIDVATEGGVFPVVYALLARTVRDISSFSSHREEQEVVFLPKTAFLLGRTIKTGAMTAHLVHELVRDEQGRFEPPSPAEVDLVHEAADSALASWQPGSESVASVPGKFSGDIA